LPLNSAFVSWDRYTSHPMSFRLHWPVPHVSLHVSDPTTEANFWTAIV
jgi:hypothetical protein